MDRTRHEPRETQLIPVDSIEVPTGRREVRDDDVKCIAESMQEIDLLIPISVRPNGHGSVLVTGAHRLAAAKLLGWDSIECFHVEGDETDAKLEEIAENLHRKELTVLERAELVVQWTELVEKRISAHVAPKMKRGRPKSGVRATARELGITREEIRRAKTIASLSDKAKEIAREGGFDGNQSALLEAGKERTSQRQVASLKARATRKRQTVRAEADICERARQAVCAMATPAGRTSPTTRSA